MAYAHHKRASKKPPLRVRLRHEMRFGEETVTGSISVSPSMALAVLRGRAVLTWAYIQGPAGPAELRGSVRDARLHIDMTPEQRECARVQFEADVAALGPRASGMIGGLRRKVAMNTGGQRGTYAALVQAAAAELTMMNKQGRAPSRHAARQKAIRMALLRIELPAGDPSYLEQPVLWPEQHRRFEREMAGADPAQRKRHLLETFITPAFVRSALPSKKKK